MDNQKIFLSLLVCFLVKCYGMPPPPNGKDPMPATIDECLSDIGDTIKNWAKMGTAFMGSRQVCLKQCLSVIPASFKGCHNPLQSKQVIGSLAGILVQMNKSTGKLINYLTEQVAAGKCTQNKDVMSILDRSIMEKIITQTLTGPGCNMAMSSQFFPDDVKDCMYECMLDKFSQFMPNNDALKEKMEWLKGGATGPPPEIVVRYNPYLASACLFKFCEFGVLKKAMTVSDMIPTMLNATCTMRNISVNSWKPKCTCMATAADTEGVEDAPDSDDCECLTPGNSKEIDFLCSLVSDQVWTQEKSETVVNYVSGDESLSATEQIKRLFGFIAGMDIGQCEDKRAKCVDWIRTFFEELLPTPPEGEPIPQ